MGAASKTLQATSLRQTEKCNRVKVAPALQPGIYQAQAAVFKIAGVACGQDGMAGVRDGGDLRVEVCDRSALRAAADGDLRKRARGIFVEGQYLPCEVFCKCRFSLGDH